MESWKQNLLVVMAENGESWADVEFHTMTPEQIDIPFEHGYGSTEGTPFTLWTKNRVYFPACYDGAEWVASVPRNPCNEATEHVGGG